MGDVCLQFNLIWNRIPIIASCCIPGDLSGIYWNPVSGNRRGPFNEQANSEIHGYVADIHSESASGHTGHACREESLPTFPSTRSSNWVSNLSRTHRRLSESTSASSSKYRYDENTSVLWTTSRPTFAFEKNQDGSGITFHAAMYDGSFKRERLGDASLYSGTTFSICNVHIFMNSMLRWYVLILHSWRIWLCKTGDTDSSKTHCLDCDLRGP